MKKADVERIVKQYGFGELVNNEIERVQIGWSLLTDEYIDELDEIANCKADTTPVTVTAEYTGYQHSTLYKIYVPSSWIYGRPHNDAR